MIALIETANGIFRVRFLAARLGRKKALLVSFFSGSFCILVLSWLLLAWLEPQSIRECLIIGLCWAGLMVAYDVMIGRYAFGYSWKRILADFDLRQGNLLTLGIALILLAPYLLYVLQKTYLK